MSRWGEDTTFKFVCRYVHHDCLWNHALPAYKNKHLKLCAYRDIEKHMNIPGFGTVQLRAKIKNIRSTYSQEKKKIAESIKSGADRIYVPTIKWFTVLDDALRNITNDMPENDSVLEDYEHELFSYAPVPEPETEQEGTISPVQPAENYAPPLKKFKPNPNKKKIAQLNGIVTKLERISQAASNEEDEFEVFGRHVGLQLKSLPLLLALEAQEQIQLQINKVRRQHILQHYKQDGRSELSCDSLKSADDNAVASTCSNE